MENQDRILLEKAADEIKALRRENEKMSLRLQMFDDMMLLFRTPPLYPAFGMSPDIIYDVEKRLQDIKK